MCRSRACPIASTCRPAGFWADRDQIRGRWVRGRREDWTAYSEMPMIRPGGVEEALGALSESAKRALRKDGALCRTTVRGAFEDGSVCAARQGGGRGGHPRRHVRPAQTGQVVRVAEKGSQLISEPTRPIGKGSERPSRGCTKSVPKLFIAGRAKLCRSERKRRSQRVLALPGNRCSSWSARVHPKTG